MSAHGKLFGGVYEILGPLGSGGMGEVHRARDNRLGREVAIKILPAELSADTDRMARFEQEARAASALNHPNIVTIHDTGREGEAAYQVLELVEGRSLREIVGSGPLPLRRALHIAEQTAAGLTAAHAAGIVHRDLKPDNIMVREDGVVKILDFGLAKLEKTGASAASLLPTSVGTSPGTIMGTVAYMSPEQARGASVDFRSDQFALGVTLYEMITGTRPFRGDSPAQTMTAIIEKEPETVSRLRADVPRPLVWILDRCLAKEPAERYASTADLARDLTTVRENLSEISSGAEAVVAAQPQTSRRSGVRRIAGMLALALAGLVAGALLGARFLAPPSSPGLEPPTLRTLSFSGSDYHPTASPDGRMIAFTSERDGVRRIYMKSLKDGSEVPLTSGPDYRPRFSPDGSSILFSHYDGMAMSLYRVPILGGEPRKLVGSASDGDYSPDGQRIVFLRVGTGGGATVTSVAIAREDGGDERVIAKIDQAALAGPRWSPDGSRIAVSASQYGLSESVGKYILILKADGSEPRKLYPPVEGGDVSGVAWIGDGRSIVYAQGESISTVSLATTLVNAGASRIVIQDVDSGSGRVALWTPSLATLVDIVGPGRIVFDSLAGRENLEEFETGAAAGTGRRVLSGGTSIDRQPAYSPDGQVIAFSSNRSGNLDIWTRSTRTGDLRRLTDHPADDWDPAFTSDGKQLIWTSRRSGNFEIWMADADGGGARQVTHDEVDAENATPTPDGKWLVYNSGNPEKSGIWKIRPDGSEATRLIAGTFLWPEVSPDGRHASYARTTSAGLVELDVVRIEDGLVEPFKIELPSAEGLGGRTRWLPDGRIALNYKIDGHPGVYAQEFRPGADTTSSRRPLVLLEPDSFPETFGVSPDGSRLTLAVTRRSYSLMGSENVAGIEPPHRGR